LLHETAVDLDAVIELKVDEAVLVERISGRFTCAKCGAGYHDTFKLPKHTGVCDVCGSSDFIRRPDDKAETVHARLEAYNAQTAPILPYYKAQGRLHSVDGMAEMDAVEAQIEIVLRKIGVPSP
jgi:adenylate kinase